MKTISSVLIIVMLTMAGGARAESCSFLGGLLCSILPCDLLRLSSWSCGTLGLDADLQIAPLMLNVKLGLSADLHVHSLSLGAGAVVTVRPNVVLDLDADLDVALGSILYIDGTVRVRGKAFIKGQVILGASGTLILDADVELMAGAIINLGVGATVTASGYLTVHPGAFINIAAAANLVLLRGGIIYGTVTVNSLGTLTVSATVTVYGTLVAFVNAQVHITATLRIEANAIVDIQGAFVLLVDVSLSGLLKLRGTCSVTLSGGLVVGITGKVDIGIAASLTIGGLLNLVGEIHVSPFAVLRVTLDATISGKLLIAASARIDLFAKVTVMLGGLISADIGASVQLHSALFIYGTVNLNGCLVSVYGIVTIQSYGWLCLTGEVQLDLYLGINIQLGARLTVGIGAVVNIHADSIIDASIDLVLGAYLNILGGITRCSIPLVIHGDVYIGATLYLGTNIYTQVSGTLTIDAAVSVSAIVCVTLYVQVSATLVGKGRITGNVEIEGILSPWAGGNLIVTSNVVIAATATVVVRIEDLYIYSRLQIGGSVAIAGDLLCVVDGLFNPVLGNLFDVIDAGSLTGLFNVVNITPSVLHWVQDLTKGTIAY